MDSGIYNIKCSENDRFYVGSSNSINARWRGHLHDLRKGNHHSIHLQRAYDKYGEEAFEFSIVEECAEEDLLPREQYYIDLYWDEGVLFNIERVAGRRDMRGEKNSFYGKKHTAESRKKISAGARQRDNTNIIAAIRERCCGVEPANIIEFSLKDPHGNIHTGTNLTHFAKEHNLRTSHLSSVLSGKRKHHKRWTRW